MDAISRGNVTDVVYLDFPKAFGTVPHKRLMVKLKAYGISGVILNGRTQRVIVNGIASRKEAILSGVPQGRVRGPLLFVLYINGLPDTLDCPCMMFADDTKSFREITYVADMNMLQNNLHLMEKWSNTWLLQFHPGNVLLCPWEYGGTLFKRIHIMSFCPLVLNMFWRIT